MAKKKKVPAGMTKREAVRRAIAELGEDAPPTQMQGHIREKFGIEMTTDHISTEKGTIRKEAAAKPPAIKSVSRTPAARRPAQLPAAGEAEPEGPAPRPAAAPQGDAIGLDDIEAVKDLVGRVGADSLRKLIDVLAR